MTSLLTDSDSAPPAPEPRRRRLGTFQWAVIGLLAAGLVMLTISAAYLVELNALWQNGSGYCSVHVERGKTLPILLTLGTLALMGGFGLWLGGRRASK
ncbi:MAG: hypothetical protein H6672_17170 [Anaerolineaceae bacterium]|nr:hypothetical protein [Anaerolineaceae bacterium]